MEFVKVIMHGPFGCDAYIECYIQINGNEEEVKFIYSNLHGNDGIQFHEVYSNEEVDVILSAHAGEYIGHADVERHVKLEGKLKIDIKAPVTDPEEWWDKLIGYAKDPKFENIAEKVTDSKEYKKTRTLYNPKNYIKPKKSKKKAENLKIII